MTTQKRDYYEILGVSRNASDDDQLGPGDGYIDVLEVVLACAANDYVFERHFLS